MKKEWIIGLGGGFFGVLLLAALAVVPILDGELQSNLNAGDNSVTNVAAVSLSSGANTAIITNDGAGAIVFENSLDMSSQDITSVNEIDSGLFTLQAGGSFGSAGLIISDGNYAGLSASKGRIIFRDLVTDEIELNTANLDGNGNRITNVAEFVATGTPGFSGDGSGLTGVSASAAEIRDEGVVVHSGPTQLDAVGAGIVASSNSATLATLTVAGGGGSGAFSDAADPIVQNTITKDVHIGDGAGTLVGKLEIGGDADQPQLVVEGHSVQTDSLIVGQNDADTEVFNVDVDGTIKTLVGLDAIGAVDMDYGSPDVTDHTFQTDGTGDSEVVLPDDAINAAEIGELTAPMLFTNTYLELSSDNLTAYATAGDALRLHEDPDNFGGLEIESGATGTEKALTVNTLNGADRMTLTASGVLTLQSNIQLAAGADLKIQSGGSLELGAATDTTLARSGAGDVTIEGQQIHRLGGTDITDADIEDAITINPVNATTETAIEAVVDLSDLQGEVTDGQVPDTITLANYVAEASGASTNQALETPSVTGAATFDNGATSAGRIRIKEDSDAGAQYVEIIATNMVSNYTIVLPADDGASGQFLLTDGAGNTSWSTPGGGGTMSTVKEAATPVGDADIATLDFGAGFDLTESPDTEINIVLDYTEDPVNLASAEVTGEAADANVSDTLTIGASSTVAGDAITDGTVDNSEIDESTLTHANFGGLGADDHPAVYLNNTNLVYTWQSDGTIVEEGLPSADTDAARGTLLKSALDSASWGDTVVFVGPMTYDMSDALGYNVTDGVNIVGIGNPTLQYNEAFTYQTNRFEGFTFEFNTADGWLFNGSVGFPVLTMKNMNFTGTAADMIELTRAQRLLYDGGRMDCDWDIVRTAGAVAMDLEFRNVHFFTDGSGFAGDIDGLKFEATGVQTLQFFNCTAELNDGDVDSTALWFSNANASSRLLWVGGTFVSNQKNIGINSTVTGEVIIDADFDPAGVVDTGSDLNNALIIDRPNERVGIGTNAPATALEVVGTLTGDAATLSGNITQADEAWIGLGAAKARMIWDDLATDEVELRDAWMAIGNAAPLERLYIYDASDGKARLRLRSNLDAADITIGAHAASRGDVYAGAGDALWLGAGDTFGVIQIPAAANQVDMAASLTVTGNTTIASNLTVSGTGESTIQGPLSAGMAFSNDVSGTLTFVAADMNRMYYVTSVGLTGTLPATTATVNGDWIGFQAEETADMTIDINAAATDRIYIKGNSTSADDAVISGSSTNASIILMDRGSTNWTTISVDHGGGTWQ